MFLGHIGLGFAAKALTLKAPLWSLLIASQIPDILSLVFISIGVEKTSVSTTSFSDGVQIQKMGSIPWSHGLTMNILWAVLFGIIAWFVFGDKNSALIISGLVLSHWLLDFFTHGPDLPLLFSNNEAVGLGLWNSGTGFITAMVIEVVMLVAGILIYIKA